MRRVILPSVACQAILYVSTLSDKQQDIRKNVTENVQFGSLYNFYPKHFSFYEELDEI
jgi:hypothetical protein